MAKCWIAGDDYRTLDEGPMEQLLLMTAWYDLIVANK